MRRVKVVNLLRDRGMLMTGPDIAVKREGSIATVTLNRSDLSLDMPRELKEIAFERRNIFCEIKRYDSIY